MNKLEAQYPVVLSQSIIWGDMDAFGHVNNKVYFRYFEDARIAYFEKVGVGEYMAKNNIGPILANTDCNFKLPLVYPGNISVSTNSRILSEKTFKMNYVVFSEQIEEVVAEGSGLIVFYDYTNNKSCAIPEPLVNAMNELENKYATLHNDN